MRRSNSVRRGVEGRRNRVDRNISAANMKREEVLRVHSELQVASLTGLMLS